jgi:hypothetical protein
MDTTTMDTMASIRVKPRRAAGRWMEIRDCISRTCFDHPIPLLKRNLVWREMEQET